MLCYVLPISNQKLKWTKIILVIIDQKYQNIKHFGENIIKYWQDIYTKNSKTLLGEIKEDLKNGQRHSASGSQDQILLRH